ncbi:MAG: NADH-quinone oxidoreductase subunit H [Alphaproteobacteria bacterium]|nr:NADH-quinone oxidoreductase subunit H [Alphaproteobacteria bacterium]
MASYYVIILAIGQGAALLLLAPLASGFSRVLRAKIHTRTGPPLLQDYRDIFKLLKRQEIVPKGAGLIFRAMPFILMATLLLIAMSMPVLTLASPLSAVGNMFTFVCLLALVRFFFSLSGVDSGSTFAGLGASRETTMCTLMEPVILLALFVAALLAGSTDLGRISVSFASPSQGLIAAELAVTAAIAFAAFVEMGKVPFDMAEAEQELQEGPLTEYSGPGLALLKWSVRLKQLVMASFLIGVFLPYGAAASPSAATLLWAAVVFLIKLVVVFVVVAVIENSVARNRFFMTSHSTWIGFGVAALALVFYLVGL